MYTLRLTGRLHLTEGEFTDNHFLDLTFNIESLDQLEPILGQALDNIHSTLTSTAPNDCADEPESETDLAGESIVSGITDWAAVVDEFHNNAERIRQRAKPQRTASCWEPLQPHDRIRERHPGFNAETDDPRPPHRLTVGEGNTLWISNASREYVTAFRLPAAYTLCKLVQEEPDTE